MLLVRDYAEIESSVQGGDTVPYDEGQLTPESDVKEVTLIDRGTQEQLTLLVPEYIETESTRMTINGVGTGSVALHTFPASDAAWRKRTEFMTYESAASEETYSPRYLSYAGFDVFIFHQGDWTDGGRVRTTYNCYFEDEELRVVSVSLLYTGEEPFEETVFDSIVATILLGMSRER